MTEHSVLFFINAAGPDTYSWTCKCGEEFSYHDWRGVQNVNWLEVADWMAYKHSGRDLMGRWS